MAFSLFLGRLRIAGRVEVKLGLVRSKPPNPTVVSSARQSPTTWTLPEALRPQS